MKEKLVKIWGTLRPEQRKKSIIAGVLIVLTRRRLRHLQEHPGQRPASAAFGKEGDQPRRGGQGRAREVPLQRVDEGYRRHEDPDGGPPEAAQGGPGDKGDAGSAVAASSPIPAQARVCPGLWRRTRGACRSRSRLPCRQLAHPRRLSLPASRRRRQQQPGMRHGRSRRGRSAPQARGLRGHQGRLPNGGRRQERC